MCRGAEKIAWFGVADRIIERFRDIVNQYELSFLALLRSWSHRGHYPHFTKA